METARVRPGIGMTATHAAGSWSIRRWRAGVALALGVALGAAPALAQTPEQEPNNTQAQANPIVVAGTPKGLRSAQISPAGDVDFFSVVARAGDLLYVLT